MSKQYFDWSAVGSVSMSEWLVSVLAVIVKLRQGSGKDRQGMALKAKGLKA